MPRNATAGQNEMLMPIAGKKPAKEAAAKKATAGAAEIGIAGLPRGISATCSRQTEDQVATHDSAAAGSA